SGARSPSCRSGLRPRILLYREQMRRQSRGVEQDEVVGALPRVRGTGKEIMHDIGPSGVEAEHVEVESYPPRLYALVIETDHGQDQIPARVRTFCTSIPGLGVGNDLVVVDPVKMKGVVELERSMVPANFVYPSDEFGEAVRASHVPRAHLVFFGTRILLRTAGARNVLLQFEGGAVDPVVRAEGGCENEAGQERSAPTGLEGLVQDVGCIGPKVRTKVVRHVGLGQLGQVGLELPLGISPREVCV